MKTDRDTRLVLKHFFSLPAPERNQRFRKTTDAARAIGISPRTLRQWISDGRVGAIKVGNTYRVDLQELEHRILQDTDGF